MPTNYTASLYDGDPSFEDFAMRCTRAFLINMREEPADAPIPEKFEPEDYFAKKVAEVEAELKEATEMTREEAFDKRLAAYEETKRLHDQFIAAGEERRPRYEAMLEKAKAWEPPAEIFKDFHAFMVKQLEDGIEHDCSSANLLPELTPPNPDTDYRQAVIQDAINEVEYAREKEQRAIDRAAEATEFVAGIRNSLGVTA